MGVYNNELIPNTVTDASTRINGITEFFNPLSGVTAETVEYLYNDVNYIGSKITIDGTNIEAFFGHKLNDAHYHLVYVKNDDIYYVPVTVTNYGSQYDDIVMHSYVDQNCIVLSVVQKVRNGFIINYIKTDDNRHLIGYKQSSLNAVPYMENISALIFEDAASTSRTQYTFTNMFPYTAQTGYVDYMGQVYFVNNGIRRYSSTALRGCSKVSYVTTVSLTDGQYVSLGTHCLALLDQETEEGG